MRKQEESVAFSRKELQEIRYRATIIAQTTGTSSHWARAYMQFADAADRIDALIARSGLNLTEEI